MIISDSAIHAQPMAVGLLSEIGIVDWDNVSGSYIYLLISIDKPYNLYSVSFCCCPMVGLSVRPSASRTVAVLMWSKFGRITPLNGGLKVEFFRVEGYARAREKKTQN